MYFTANLDTVFHERIQGGENGTFNGILNGHNTVTCPALFYFNATVLVPDAPATIESWRVHYFAVRRRYWIAICLWALVDATIDSVLLEVPLVNPGRAVQSFFFVLGVTGVVSANVLVHEVLALLVWLLPLAAIASAGGPGFSPQ